MLVAYDELAALVSSLDLHKAAKGGGNNDRALLLEAHGGNLIQIGLKGARATLANYSMPIMGGVQPDIYTGIVATSAGVSDGFAHRMAARAHPFIDVGECPQPDTTRII